MKRIITMVICLGLYAGMAGAGFAVEETKDDSLADLIYLGVSVASKKVENIHKAPGIVSVITSREIETMALETLYDIIKTIPGVTITESYFGFTSISFRGVKESHYNNRTLLLLNGHPLRDVTVGTYWLEAIPANIIEKVEIICGPGSVMYGTGAFAGVISIITKEKVNLRELSITAGSKTTTNGDAVLGMNFENVDFIVGGSYNNNTGYDAKVRDEIGADAQMGYYTQDPDAYENDFYNIFGNVSLDDFKLDMYHFKQEKDKFGIVPIHAMTGEADMSSSGLALRYYKKTRLWEANSIVYYDHSFYNGYMDGFAGTEIEMSYSGNKFGLDAGGIFELSPALEVSAGASYEYQKTDPYEFYDLIQNESHWGTAFETKYETGDFSLYTQLEFEPVEPLKILGGVRYNNNREYGGTFVPRVSIVYSVSEKVVMKLLYGSAYRNPTFFEKYVNTRNVLYGDPDLKPEKIDTIELSTVWVLMKSMFRLTFFGLSTDDMIGRVVRYNAGDVPAVAQLESRAYSTIPTVTTPGYGNTQGQQIFGAELEVKGDIIKDIIAYTLNGSYKEGKEKTDWTSIQYLDQVVANFIVVNKVGGFTNTLTLGYVGARKGNIYNVVAAPGFTPGQEITIPSHTLLNLKITYEIHRNLQVSLQVINLLGQDVLYPEYIRRRIDAIPGDSGTNFFGQVKYSF
ncbi:TonB-dependent receptor [bacterium]|nr:TonB-dependent receptor [bacterium]